MLAYVFWHWRRPACPPPYEALQRRFHAALEAAPPAGFSGSRSLAIAGAPWAADGGQAYEDWYLLEGSAALDPLNAAAVTASRQQPHDAAAAAAEGGTAGLYLAPPRRAARPAARRDLVRQAVGHELRRAVRPLGDLVEPRAARSGVAR